MRLPIHEQPQKGPSWIELKKSSWECLMEISICLLFPLSWLCCLSYARIFFRSFSMARRLKTWLFSTMSQKGCQWLCGRVTQVDLMISVLLFRVIDSSRYSWAFSCWGYMIWYFCSEVFVKLYIFLHVNIWLCCLHIKFYYILNKTKVFSLINNFTF